MTKKLPEFTIARRVEVEHDGERAARQGLAELVRFSARATVDAQLLAMQSRRRRLENAASIGGALAKLDLRGWRKALLTFGIQDSEFLDRCVELSTTQIRRLVVDEGPAVIARAEEVARAIETTTSAPSATADTPDEPSAEADESEPDGAPPSRWG